ncbi:hypothetical protein IP88_03130, partial [alpha proteobacterium AAP81b]
MNASDLLNADMATLARWGRQGLAWWTAELAALVPARWRAPAARARAVLHLDDRARLVGTAPPPRSR